jgi:galactose mutarotase-like enzyme
VSAESKSWARLSSDDLVAEIDPHGAQLSVLRDRAGRDLLWGGDPAVWAGRAPLLFPIVGTLAGGVYRLGGRTYALARHGFARGKKFSVSRSDESSAVFTLRENAATLEVYPFHFELTAHFELVGPTLSVTTRVGNRGDEPMPASVGYHPGFRWPLPFGQPRAAHFVEFEVEEPDPVRRIDSLGLLTPERHPTPIAHRRLPLTDALFADDVLILDRVRSRSVLYGSDHGPRLRLSFPDAPFLGLWTKPDAQFICIEPWHGVTDLTGYSGDFRDKPGVFVLPPGAVLSTTMTVTWVAGG